MIYTFFHQITFKLTFYKIMKIIIMNKIDSFYCQQLNNTKQICILWLFLTLYLTKYYTTMTFWSDAFLSLSNISTKISIKFKKLKLQQLTKGYEKFKFYFWQVNIIKITFVTELLLFKYNGCDYCISAICWTLLYLDVPLNTNYT